MEFLLEGYFVRNGAHPAPIDQNFTAPNKIQAIKKASKIVSRLLKSQEKLGVGCSINYKLYAIKLIDGVICEGKKILRFVPKKKSI